MFPFDDVIMPCKEPCFEDKLTYDMVYYIDGLEQKKT